MVDISKFDSKSNGNTDKLSFSRHPSRKKLSFEQSLASGDISSFSTACIGGKLYQLIQSGQHSSFSSFNFNKTKNDLLPEKLNQFNEFIDSQHNYKLAQLTINHPEDNDDESPDSEVVMEVSEELFSYSSSLMNDNRSNQNELLAMSTEIQNCKHCDKCACCIF